MVAAEELQKHRGRWVAYRANDGRIVAGCATLDELRQQVIEAGEEPSEIGLIHVPDESEEAALGGLELQ